MQTHEAPTRTCHGDARDIAVLGSDVAEYSVPESRCITRAISDTRREQHVAGTSSHGSEQVDFVLELGLEVENPLEESATGIVHPVGNRLVFLDRREGSGDLAAVGNGVQQDARRRKAHGPSGHRLGHDLAHTCQFVRGGDGIFGHRALAHHVIAHGAVADHTDHVESRVQALHRIEVLRESLPIPRKTTENRLTRNVFHAFHEFGEIAARLGGHRGESDTAVTHENRGHAVPRRRSHERIPSDLRVEMSVQVDESRGHHMTGGVDLTCGLDPRQIADRRDAITVDRHISEHCFGTDSIDDRSTANDEIVSHDNPLWSFPLTTSKCSPRLVG